MGFKDSWPRKPRNADHVPTSTMYGAWYGSPSRKEVGTKERQVLFSDAHTPKTTAREMREYMLASKASKKSRTPVLENPNGNLPHPCLHRLQDKLSGKSTPTPKSQDYKHLGTWASTTIGSNTLMITYPVLGRCSV